MAAATDCKIALLSAAARFDICTTCDAPPPHPGSDILTPSITHLHQPDGGRLSVLKILLTDACQYDCLYCANRSPLARRRHSFAPAELASLFADLHARGLVNGLFLSSGIRGSPADTMAEMLTTAEILRERHRFAGYIHLKVLPGAPYDCVQRAVELSDRVSVNMEAPTQRGLDHLSTRKRLSEDIIQRMHWIRQAARGAAAGSLKSGQTTQFVVGAAGESDREILHAAEALRRSIGLRRAYFSAFRPVPGTPLADEAPAPLLRQHRLYQTDWLLRRYGFQLSEIVFDDHGHLPLSVDPKLAFALRNPHLFPVEVNRAARSELLRVPGIGIRSADRILAARCGARLISLRDLQRLGIVGRRAAPFLLINGHSEGRIADLLRRDAAPTPEQLELLPPGTFPADVAHL